MPAAPVRMRSAACSGLSETTTTCVLCFFASATTFERLSVSVSLMMSTAARKRSRDIQTWSAFCACATMRRSSSTASTLAAPARKMAWLSARITFNIAKSFTPLELVFVDDACDAALAGLLRLFFPHHASGAADGDVGLGAEHVFGQADIEAPGGSNGEPGGSAGGSQWRARSKLRGTHRRHSRSRWWCLACRRRVTGW